MLTATRSLASIRYTPPSLRAFRRPCSIRRTILLVLTPSSLAAVRTVIVKSILLYGGRNSYASRYAGCRQCKCTVGLIVAIAFELFLTKQGNTMVNVRLTDWKCSGCGHWNQKTGVGKPRVQCRKCARVHLPGESWTRARIAERIAERRTMATLRKHGLTGPDVRPFRYAATPDEP